MKSDAVTSAVPSSAILTPTTSPSPSINITAATILVITHIATRSPFITRSGKPFFDAMPRRTKWVQEFDARYALAFEVAEEIVNTEEGRVIIAGHVLHIHVGFGELYEQLLRAMPGGWATASNDEVQRVIMLYVNKLTCCVAVNVVTKTFVWTFTGDFPLLLPPPPPPWRDPVCA